MAFVTDSSIFPHGVDDMLFNSAGSSVHTESTSSSPFIDVDQYFSPTGEISFSPPSIVDNVFVFGDPMFQSDFSPDLTNEFSFLNLYSPSFDSVSEPVDAFVPYSESCSLPHVEGTDEDAEFDLDPEYDSEVNADCTECDSGSVNASNATQASFPSSEYRDWSPSSSSSDSCTVVDFEDDTPNPFAESSSDTCCSEDDGSDYGEPAAGSRKRARTLQTDEDSTSESPQTKRGKKANFKESSERYEFHDLTVEVRCIEKTCDVMLWSINSAIDHFNETHAFNVSVRCAYPKCNETAGSVGDMRRHFLTLKHQPHRFMCHTCPTMFTRRDAMLRHVRKTKGRCKNRPVRKVTAKRAPVRKAVKKGRTSKAKA
ncbi:hypothetical protein IW262DRAFT_1458088 [Armillaria fumosa]|nr:hypothetical protein IW262DRAFT_1458088 [Armillaria fumosa]